MFDGFYGICTDLEASLLELIKINKSRWEIERCFREMKTEFQACPVYLSMELHMALNLKMLQWLCTKQMNI